MITIYNTAVTDISSEIFENVAGKKPWVTRDVFDLCDEWRELKKQRYEAEGAKAYRKQNTRIQKSMKKAKEDWKVLSARRSKLSDTTAREHISW